MRSVSTYLRDGALSFRAEKAGFPGSRYQSIHEEDRL
jgi:hypothetical protein